MKTNTKIIRPLNENTKQACLRCFEQYLEEDFLFPEKSIIYDLLDAAGFIKFTANEKRQFQSKSIAMLTEKENQKPKASRKLNYINSANSLAVIFQAKVLALETLFAKIDADNKHLKDIIN